MWAHVQSAEVGGTVSRGRYYSAGLGKRKFVPILLAEA